MYTLLCIMINFVFNKNKYFNFAKVFNSFIRFRLNENFLEKMYGFLSLQGSLKSMYGCSFK